MVMEKFKRDFSLGDTCIVNTPSAASVLINPRLKSGELVGKKAKIRNLFEYNVHGAVLFVEFTMEETNEIYFTLSYLTNGREFKFCE